MHINRESFAPLYYQIEHDLLRLIQEGEYKSGDQLPPEKELQKKYRVSRTTIRIALSILVQKGFVVRFPGRGTFVTKPKLNHYIGEITSFTKEMIEAGLKPSTKILQFTKLVPPEDIASDLNLEKEEKVVFLRRLRFVNDQPVAISSIYIPEFMVPGLPDDGIEGESFYTYLKKKYGWKLVETDETVDATLITGEEAKLLQVQPGSPGLLVGRISFVQDERIIERAFTIYRGDRFTYHAKLHGGRMTYIES